MSGRKCGLLYPTGYWYRISLAEYRYRILKISGYQYPVSCWISGKSNLVPGTLADILKVKSGIRSDTCYPEWPDYPAGYLVHPYS
jgi:hypothetical protein